MDDLLSQVSQQFEEDIKNEEPKKEEIKNEEIIKERFKVSERYIKQRREMVELSKIESENSDTILKSKTKSRSNERKEEPTQKKEEKRSGGYGYGSSGYGYGGYGSSSSQSKKDESTKNQEKATEYADNVFDSLRGKIEDEFNADIPEDWDIFDIHNKANENHKIAKEVKSKGKLPLSVKIKLAALKACIYTGHSTLETLYVLKNE